jgi:hypothetical protein
VRHLSFAPISKPALDLLTLELLRETVMQSEVMGKEIVLVRLPAVFESHFGKVCLPNFIL